MPYRSLYIHVPFCQGGKCAYCAFYSLPTVTPAMTAAWLERLKHDFAANAPQCAPLRSVFIGGGTPSCLEPNELQTLLDAVRNAFDLTDDCEWTMEANPESLTPEKIDLAATGGVNRFSLGVQSFNEKLRRRIGRRGTLERLPSLLETLHASSDIRLNLDLIYAIPDETPDEWADDLRRALACRPDHVSCYSLITEEGTPLAGQKLPQVTDESFLACWNLTERILSEAGLPRYEISNFAQPGRHCRHNDEIWHGQTYLGCGPAAVSFDGRDRIAEPADLEAWLAPHAPAVDTLPPEQRRREILAFGMRTVEGWPWPLLREVCGWTRTQLETDDAVRQALERQLALLDGTGFRPTSEGLLFNDDLLELLL